MKFCDKLYVGFQRERYQSSDTPRVLGFAVPYGETKVEKKRMGTVDRWANKKEDNRIIENTPARGFKLLEVVSRYSTSNKLFRVLDPRGFELEISSDNLLDIAIASTIVRGEIIEECVWAQHNGAYLMPTSSDRYQFWAGGKSKPKTKIEAGKYYVNVGNLLSVFRFEGIHHHTYMEVSHKATDCKIEYGETSPYYSRSRDQVIVTAYTTTAKIKMNTGNKPSYIYTEFILDEDGNLERKTIHARKSHFKDLKEYDEELPRDVVDFSPDLTQWADTESVWSRDEAKDRLTMNTYGGYSAFFKTKEEARNFDYGSRIGHLRPNTGGYLSIIDISDVRPSNYSTWRNYYSYDTRISDVAVQQFNILDER